MTGRRRATAAFTMVEIALCLAIIGFALVAIIGVLPTGLTVQRDNREDTIVNFDAAFLMDAIRSGARAQDDLTNYVIRITNTWRNYTFNGYTTTPVPGDTGLHMNWFTGGPGGDYELDGMTGPAGSPFLTNGANIIGLLSVPKYSYIYQTPTTGTFLRSNYVSVDIRGINGSAVQEGTNQPARDFAFTYRLEPEIIPSGIGISYDPAWYATNNLNDPQWQAARDFQGNLSEIRLRFRWPVLPSGKTGFRRQVFRTSAGGPVISNNFSGVPLFFIQPQIYTNNPVVARQQ